MIPNTDLHPLAAAFERARIPLRIVEAPFVRGVADSRIVQMDNGRRRRRGCESEEISLHPGEGTSLRVLSADRTLQQLVLLVHEPERRFLERTWNRRTRKWIERTRTTSDSKRRFLIGMDERHLFIAELASRITTVAQAHLGLRPAPVEEARQHGTKVVRQGEWFFVPAGDAERVEIQRIVGEVGIRRRASLNLWAGGRPHVVSEMVRAGEAFFVRGRVRHPDHATIHLHDWMRVERNTELRGIASSGLNRWVD